MTGNVWGADVAQLRTLAQLFGKTADLLQQQSTQLSNQINNNPAWKGRDADHFRSHWKGSHRALVQQTTSRLKRWAMAQRPDVTAAGANLIVIREHLHTHPQGGATLRRRVEPTGQTLYVKKGGDGSWTIGTANTEQKDIAETTGLGDAALLDQIRTIRQDGL